MLELGESADVVFRDRPAAVVRANAGAEYLNPAGFRGSLPFEDGTFEMVVVHRMYGQSAASLGRQWIASMMAEAARVLVKDGVVAGIAGSPVRLDDCSRGLRDAGFGASQIYSILPSRATPRTLIAFEEPLTSASFRSYVKESRSYFRSSTQVLRRILAELGAGRFLIDDFTFVARKSC